MRFKKINKSKLHLLSVRDGIEYHVHIIPENSRPFAKKKYAIRVIDSHIHLQYDAAAFGVIFKNMRLVKKYCRKLHSGKIDWRKLELQRETALAIEMEKERIARIEAINEECQVFLRQYLEPYNLDYKKFFDILDGYEGMSLNAHFCAAACRNI